MPAPAPRRRKSAVTVIRTPVKSSIVVSREIHCRWQAAASLRGMTANAFAVEALTRALHGIVVIDRSKMPDHVETTDRREGGLHINSPTGESAA
jgi:hypothetical protein